MRARTRKGVGERGGGEKGKEIKRKKKREIKSRTTGHYGVNSVPGTHYHARQETMGRRLRSGKNDGKISLHMRLK